MVTAKDREERKPQMIATDYMCWQGAGEPWEDFPWEKQGQFSYWKTLLGDGLQGGKSGDLELVGKEQTPASE